MSGMMSNSPRKIFNAWDGKGLPAGTNEIGKLHAGEDHIGEVGTSYGVTTSTFYLDTAAYAAFDNCASGVAAFGAIEFKNAARVNGGAGIIRAAVFADTALQSPDLTLFVFSTVPGTTHGLVNATFMLADADLIGVAGIITCGTNTGYMGALANTGKAWVNVVDGGIQFVPTAIPFVCATGTSLYGRLRADGAWDAVTANDLTIKLLVERS